MPSLAPRPTADKCVDRTLIEVVEIAAPPPHPPLERSQQCELAFDGGRRITPAQQVPRKGTVVIDAFTSGSARADSHRAISHTVLPSRIPSEEGQPDYAERSKKNLRELPGTVRKGKASA